MKSLSSRSGAAKHTSSPSGGRRGKREERERRDEREETYHHHHPHNHPHQRGGGGERTIGKEENEKISSNSSSSSSNTNTNINININSNMRESNMNSGKSEYYSALKNMNWNVKFSFLFTAGNIAAWSITQGQLLSGFLFLLAGGSNSFVGTCHALTGVAQLSAFPIGFFGDKYRRDTLFYFGGYVGIMMFTFSVIGFYYVSPLQVSECDPEDPGCENNHPVLACMDDSMCIFIYFMVFFWGLWDGCTIPILESIFADSVATGDRTPIYTLKFLVFRFSQSLGPLLTIIMLLLFGNEWKLSTLRPILLSGTLFWILPIITTFLFDDDKALGQISEGIGQELKSGGKEKKTVRFVEEIKEEEEEEEEEIEEEVKEETLMGVNEPPKKGIDWSRVCFLRHFHPSSPNFVPLMLSGSDFINACASGMTIMFFPLFFQLEANMSPLAVSVVYFLIPLACAFFSYVSERISKTTGRIPTIFVSRFLSVTFLWSIMFSSNAVVVSTFFVLRTSLMRSPVPLVRSVLMDVVKKSNRGKWNAVESFSSFSFLGSAMVGGYLIDWKGYGFSLLITGIFQYIALLPLLPLFKYFSEKDVEKAKMTNISEVES